MFTFEINNQEIESPIGWDDLTLTLIRDDFYHGIDFRVDTELTFIKRGYEILKTAIDNRNFDGLFVLKIFYRDAEIYRGELNLFKYVEDCKQIKVPVKQINFFEQLVSRQTLEIDLYKPNGIDGQPLSVVDKIGYNFNFDAIPIFLESRWIKTDDIIQTLGMTGSTGLLQLSVAPFVNVVSGELQQAQTGDDYGMANAGQPVVNVFEQKYLSESQWHLNTEFQVPPLPGVYIFNYDLSGVLGYEHTNTPGWTAVGVEIRLVYGTQANNTVVTLFSSALGNTPPGDEVAYNITGTQNITLAENDKVSLQIFFTGLIATGTGGVAFDFEFYSKNNDWNFSVESETVFATTQQKVSAIYEVWNRILESITGKNNVLRSKYYGRTNSQPQTYNGNGCGSFRVISNGSNIRGFDEMADEDSQEYRPPILSLQSMFESMNAIDNIGMGVEENQVIIEDKAHFYQDELIEDLGEIKDIQFSIVENLFYNEVKVGYSDYEDTINRGLSEFASQRQYTNKVRNNKAVLEIISDLIASPFAIELTRRDSKVYKPNASSKWDDSNFIIQANRRLSIDGFPLLVSPSTVTSGVVGQQPTSVTNASSGDNLYNVEISPVRNLLRHLNVLPDVWNFVSGLGNYKMRSIVDDYGCEGLFDGNQLSEREDGLHTNELLYYPIKASFDHPACIEKFMEWSDKKYGYFEFTFREEIFQAYILDVKFNNRENKCNFELILKK